MMSKFDLFGPPAVILIKIKQVSYLRAEIMYETKARACKIRICGAKRAQTRRTKLSMTVSEV